jgi:hypothetical protein
MVIVIVNSMSSGFSHFRRQRMSFVPSKCVAACFGNSIGWMPVTLPRTILYQTILTKTRSDATTKAAQPLRCVSLRAAARHTYFRGDSVFDALQMEQRLARRFG